MIHIKEVAKQTKITVRTLRYYDQIGLLAPSSKTEGGHRLYTEEELKRLQYIQFFKGMGYKLNEIKEMLSDDGWNWTTGLESQLAYILEDQKRLSTIESSLRELIHGIAVEGGDEWSAIKKLIQLSQQNKKRLSAYRESALANDELRLWNKLPRMNGNDPDSLEWIALLGQIRRSMNEEDPASPKVQNIIRRMLEKQAEQFEGEEAFVDKMWEIRKSPQQSARLGLYPIEAEVLAYMERAYEIHVSSLANSTDRRGGAT